MVQVILKTDVFRLFLEMEKYANELRSKFQQKESSEVLIGSLILLIKLYEECETKLDKTVFYGSRLSRHLSFIEKYLNENSPEECISDIDEICETDIKYLKNNYQEKNGTLLMDKELEENVKTLVYNNELDSALRKGFLVLTTRLRTKYDMPKDKDGVDLVNSIFGKSGKSKTDIKEKESFRDLLSGLYGVFRNDYMHNLKMEKETEFAALLMINTMLFMLEKIK